jgi:ABC-2 type transport system ATP-binding protein
MLTADGIVKKYKQTVLNGVSLSINPGEIVGIAGENGSGKSTLLSVLTAVMKPELGQVTVEGCDIFRNPKALRKWVGFVPQENALFNDLTARDNLKLWASAYGSDWKSAFDFLFPAEMPDAERKAFLKKKAYALSGGMKKRLSIALALTHGPRYLIMDEPSAGLDIVFKWTLMELMQAIRSEGNSVLFTSHQPDELKWCDRIYILRKGVFIYEGEPGVLAASGDLSETLRRIIHADMV